MFTKYSKLGTWMKINLNLQRVVLCVDASVVNGVSVVYGEQQ